MSRPGAGPARRITIVALALAAALSPSCNQSDPESDLPLPVPATEAREVTVTLDRCDCDLCRLALSRPATGEGLFNRTDLQVGVEAIAVTCDIDDSITIALECGDCAVPPCTAAATVRAGGLPVDRAPACTVASGAGGTCLYHETAGFDPLAPTFNCGP